MKLTLLLIAACILVFIYMVFQPAETQESMFNEYGFSGANMLQRPYVFLTSIFVHADVEHILSNMLILLFFGIAVEGELGKGKMLLIFFLGAIAGDLLSLLIYSFDSLAVGASAAIFALIGVGMLVKPFNLSLAPFIVPVPLGVLGIIYIIYNIYGFITEPAGTIAYMAHFGGLLVGLAFGFHETGWKKGLKAVLISLLILTLIPVIWMIISSLI